MSADALADLVVLDLAQDVAGPYCAKLFADFGATVIKLEPAGGDRARALPLADDPSLRASAGRDAARSRVNEALSTWTLEHDPETVMSRLQAAGVPAAADRYTGEMLADPQLRARGFWQTLERDFVGPLSHPAAPYRFRAEPLPVSTPAPTLGQHSRQVLTELLGLEAAELEALEAQGVIGTRPARKAT